MDIVRLENGLLSVAVAPSVGGRVVSLLHKRSGHEFLWRNPTLPLRRVPPGTAYDPEFYGGIDEQIPCDGPETFDGVAYPDHGELWTQSLAVRKEGEALVLSGDLPLLGFHYERRMELVPDAPELRVSYRIENRSGRPRSFLWKLHAALAVAPGDRIVCPAITARPLDLAWSRCREMKPFAWPHEGDLDMSLVPALDGTAEFLALTGLAAGTIGLRRAATGTELRIEFDRTVFPWCWLFASYGKLLGHHTVVLEPATSAESTVHQARRPARLAAGQSLTTEVCYRVTTKGEQD
jgi:galactose mutarotase-like enzyme